MNTLNILIVEDEVIIANDIKDMLEEMGHTVLDICISGKEAYTALNSHKIDLILLDINLKGEINGIDIAESINEKYKTPFIFLTSHSDDATVKEAISKNPDGYVVKPFEKADLFTAISLCMHKKGNDQSNHNVITEKDHFFIKDGTTYVKLPYENIRFLRSSGNYVDVHCCEGKHTVRSTIKDLKENLPENKFIQIHKSIIINSHFLDSFNSNSAFIGKEELSIGRAYKDNLKNLLG